ncbi:hypothetical protein [Daejeonella sp.]|uniref:hypothetical protein n=1 Tax=Daejeonella sp. TaxID=2805397 RepID=UPI0039833776
MENWIIISSLLLLAFLSWKEIQRNNKARVGFRLVATVLAVGSLYFITRPITIERKLDPSKENTAVLLTQGFEQDSLAGLKNIPSYSVERSIVTKYKNVKFIPDLEYFGRSLADINKIHILGNGLDQHELEVLKDYQLIFHPGIVSGFTSVNWNNTIRSGEKLTVQGSFKSKSNKPVQILLRGLSTTLDSVEVTDDEIFELSTSPKLLNRAVYSLIALSGKDSLASEKIPVIIEEKTPLKILMLSSSPDFESKFLKNWLYAEKYALVIRSNISKGKFSTEFLNTERINLNRVSPALLEDYDILIGDMSALSGLSAAESSAIQNAVSKGLGMLIRADDTGGSGFFRRAFNIRQNRAIDQKSLALSWEGRSAKKASIPSGQTMEIASRSGEQALVRDNKSHILASSKIYGVGRMIISTVPDTYTWMLSNNSADYSSYWSHILEKAARKREVKESWTVLNQFPVVNSPVALRVESPSGNMPTARVSNIPLRFAQNSIQSYRWKADFWPTETGWQSIKSANGESWLYVYESRDWGSARAAEKVKTTARFTAESNATVQTAGNVVRTYNYTIPAIWFYLMFLACSAVLWAEKKLLA